MVVSGQEPGVLFLSLFKQTLGSLESSESVANDTISWLVHARLTVVQTLCLPFVCFPFCISLLNPSVQFSSVAQLCPTLCDPMNRSTTCLPVHHKLPEFTQTHVHQVGDAMQPSHPLSLGMHKSMYFI